MPSLIAHGRAAGPSLPDTAQTASVVLPGMGAGIFKIGNVLTDAEINILVIINPVLTRRRKNGDEKTDRGYRRKQKPYGTGYAGEKAFDESAIYAHREYQEKEADFQKERRYDLQLLLQLPAAGGGYPAVQHHCTREGYETAGQVKLHLQ
jgi:hypothetical protein